MTDGNTAYDQELERARAAFRAAPAGIHPLSLNLYNETRDAAARVVARLRVSTDAQERAKAEQYAQMYAQLFNGYPVFLANPRVLSAYSGQPVPPAQSFAFYCQTCASSVLQQAQTRYPPGSPMLHADPQLKSFNEAYNALGSAQRGGITGQFHDPDAAARGESWWSGLKLPGIAGGLLGGLLFSKLFKQDSWIGKLIAAGGGALVGAVGSNIAWDWISKMINGNQQTNVQSTGQGAFPPGSAQEQQYYREYAPRLAQAYQQLANHAAGPGKVTVNVEYNAANRQLELSVQPGPHGTAATLQANLQRITAFAASHNLQMPVQRLADNRFALNINDLQARQGGAEGLLTAIGMALPRSQAVENHGNPDFYYPSLPAGLGQPPVPPGPALPGGR